MNESDIPLPLCKSACRRLIRKILRDLNYKNIKITLIACSKADMLKMKQIYFSEIVDTDVITFTLQETNPLEGEIYHGPEQICENAKEFSQSFEREFARIIIHGCCHLAGYNDETAEEKKIMTALENKFLGKYFD